MSQDGSASGDAAWRADWERELNRLELDLDVVARILERGESPQIDPWTPPVMRRPMPRDLLPRAKDIAQRQAQMSARLAAQMSSNRHQRQYASAVDRSADGTHGGRYLDVSA